MKIGLQVVRFDWPGNPQNIGSKLAEIARTADAGGFASLWVMDHFFQMGGSFGAPESPMLEGYTTLGYMAAVTQRVQLGLMVGNVTARHPGENPFDTGCALRRAGLSGNRSGLVRRRSARTRNPVSAAQRTLRTVGRNHPDFSTNVGGGSHAVPGKTLPAYRAD